MSTVGLKRSIPSWPELSLDGCFSFYLCLGNLSTKAFLQKVHSFQSYFFLFLKDKFLFLILLFKCNQNKIFSWRKIWKMQKNTEALKNSLINIKEKLYQRRWRWKEDFIQDYCNTKRESELDSESFQMLGWACGKAWELLAGRGRSLWGGPPEYASWCLWKWGSFPPTETRKLGLLLSI